MTTLSCRCYFCDVTISKLKVMINIYKVYLKKMISTLNFVKQVINLGVRVLIFYSDSAQLPIINVHSTRTINFSITNTYTPWGNNVSDEALT